MSAIDLRVWKELSARAIPKHTNGVEVTRGASGPEGFPEEEEALGEAVVDADGIGAFKGEGDWLGVVVAAVEREGDRPRLRPAP